MTQVSTVASAAARMGRRFGVIPCGTLNHFAKDLNLPLELEAAVAIRRRYNLAHRIDPRSEQSRT